MSIKAAVEAYRESAYQAAEYGIERRVNAASLPVFGGIIAGLKQVGNALWRPFKIGGALLFGFESNPEGVSKASIPEDLHQTKMGENLEKFRDYAHKSADLRAQGVGEFLHFEFGAGFRKYAAARHQDKQTEHVLFPEEAEARLKAEIAAQTRAQIARQNQGRSQNNLAYVADLLKQTAPSATTQPRPEFLQNILDKGPGAKNTGSDKGVGL